MKYSMIAAAAAALIALEGTALACSCLATEDPAELQRMGVESAREAVAVVEVEALTAYQDTGAGEQMQVVRTLAGTAPARFVIERGPHVPSSASCDILYTPGQRDVVILYPAESSGTALPVYRTSGLCMQHLLDKPVFLEALTGAMGSAAIVTAGERG